MGAPYSGVQGGKCVCSLDLHDEHYLPGAVTREIPGAILTSGCPVYLEPVRQQPLLHGGRIDQVQVLA